MYFRSEASGALLQLLSQGRKEFEGGGVWNRERVGGKERVQTVARKHLWHLLSRLLQMPELTARGAGVKCQCHSPRNLKDVAHVAI